MQRIYRTKYVKILAFWGGGIDTQKTLPYGSPKEVTEEIKQNVDIFNKGGGFVFGAVHNIQTNVPLENILAMIKALQSYKQDFGKKQ